MEGAATPVMVHSTVLSSSTRHTQVIAPAHLSASPAGEYEHTHPHGASRTAGQRDRDLAALSH